MLSKENWYKFNDCRTSEDLTSKITWADLEIKNLYNLVNNNLTFAREYYSSKSSVIQVPDSQFQLKFVFLGCDRIYLYWRTHKLSEFIECSLSKKISSQKPSAQETINVNHFAWVKANEWKKCYCFDITSAYSFLGLQFKFHISLAAKVNNTPTTLLELARDFENLLNNSDSLDYDMTLKSVEGEEFKVHKNILTVRCKVLKAHFEHNTKESTTTIIETSWESKVLRDVLTFLYTGSAPGINDEPEKILAAADFYQLEGLMSLCVETMVEMLTVENALGTLQVAVRYSVDSLRDQTLQFIKDGHARLITETETWANVSFEIVKMLYEFITTDEKISFNIAEEAHAEYLQKK